MKYVKLGAQAEFFFDPITRIKVYKGEIKELSSRQLSSRAVKAALNSGYLQLVIDPKNAVSYDEDIKQSVETKKEKYEKMFMKGATEEKLMKAFSMADLSGIAESYQLIVEEDETKESLVKAINEQIEENTKK